MKKVADIVIQEKMKDQLQVKDQLKVTFKIMVAVIKIHIIFTMVRTKLMTAIIAASFPMLQL